MGCNSTKIDSTNRSIVRYIDNMDDDDDRTNDDSILSQKNIAADDLIISKLKGANDNIEI